jgi:hypothetical protein
MQERIKFPKSFDFSTPFQGQRCAKKVETAHAGALHNEAIVETPGCHLQCPQPLPMMICSPSNPLLPPTKTPEKSGTKLLSFSTGKFNSSKTLTEKWRKKKKRRKFAIYCKKSSEILREKSRNKNLTPKLREKCDGNYARERSLCAICKRRPRKSKEVEHENHTLFTRIQNL